jgi:hypothetical protein
MYRNTKCLIAVGKTTHTGHNSQHVIVGSINTDLGSLGTLNSCVGEDKLEGSIVNTGEVASSSGLVLLRAESKGVHVDTFIGVAGVALVRLNPREVGSFTLREAVLSVELQLGSDNGVLSPAVHVKGGLSKHEGAGIGDGGVGVGVSGTNKSSDSGGGVGGKTRSAEVGLVVGVSGSVPVSSAVGSIHGTSRLEETIAVNEGVLADEGVGVVSADGLRSSEGMDGVGEGINGISVVEGLGTQNLEEGSIAHKGRAVIDVLIRLDNPNQLLNGVIEVELDLVGGRTDRLITSELELGNEVLVGVLGHSAALISIQEDIVNVEGGSNQRLVVGDGGRDSLARGILGSTGDRIAGGVGVAAQGSDGPQALINRTNIKVNLDLVVLKGNQGECKTRIGAKPELKRNIEGSLRKGIAGGTHLTGSLGVARTIDISEGGISDEGKLSGVTNHLEVSTLLLSSHGKLVPDVHPITILAINALATNLNLNLSDELFSGEIQPTGINTRVVGGGGVSANTHQLVNLRKSHLKISAVGKITITADRALDTTTEIGLSVEGLLNRFNSKVGVTSVSDLPESDLRITSEVYVLCAVSD